MACRWVETFSADGTRDGVSTAVPVVLTQHESVEVTRRLLARIWGYLTSK